MSARGVLPAEHVGFLLDDELICFTGGWRTWKALFRTDTKWLDTRASTLAALLAWLPEDEQIAAVKRIKQASGFRLDARSFPRALVRQRVLASASGERIPLEDSTSWGIDLRPRADELRALHHWIG